MRTRPLRLALFALFTCAACGTTVVDKPTAETSGAGASGGASTTTNNTSTTGPPAPTCALDGPCDPECCPGYVCEAGACQPHLADDQCWLAAFPATCDPRFADACGPGTSCALGLDDISVTCSGPPPTGDLGTPCDAASGCKPTLMCGQDHLCGNACCSPAECAPGQYCNSFAGQLGNLGVCGP